MRLFLLVLFFTFGLLNAQSYSPSIDKYLQSHTEVPVLIELKQKADLSKLDKSWSKKEKAQFVYTELSSLASQSQRNIIQYLKLNSIDYKSFYIINSIHAIINREQLNTLLLNNEINFIYYDQELRLLPTVDNTLIKLQSRSPVLSWGVERIEADKVWAAGYEGQGVTLAGEDTGYNWEVDGIKNKYRGFNSTNSTVDHNYNWHDAIHHASPLSSDTINPCGYSRTSPCDDHGHGTHTMGTMTASTENEAYGVAPKANWIGCRNMERGNGALSTYVECFEFFLAPTDLDGLNPKPELAPSAINNSWYCSREEGCDPSNFAIMEEVVNKLRASGVVVVVSAGNSGQVCGNISNPPGIFKSSFAVGSFAINDSISGFSSSGPVYNYKDTIIKPDVAAPGSDVLSRIHTNELASWSGTSMAGPHVAGLVALIISAYPALDGQVDKIEEIIKLSSRSIDANIDCQGSTLSARPNHVYGYGRILATEAVRLAIISKSIDENKNFGFSILPNPVHSYLNLINTNSKNGFSILDLNGKILLNNISPTYQLNVDVLSAGIYILREQVSGKNIRFIKI